MDKISAVLNRLPQNAYDPEDKSSKLYKLLESIVAEFNITMENIDRIDRMNNIDTVLPDDLYSRFGALLNIKQNKNETDEQYRNRLKVSVTSLSGGTVEAIKYAIACGLGINNDPIAMDKIHVYDAWKYNKDVDVKKEYGYVVCDIDLNQGRYSVDIEKIVNESANNVKSSGVIIQFIYYNYRVIYYKELENISYLTLSTITYDQVGE
jgi:hypothetical protein